MSYVYAYFPSITILGKFYINLRLSINMAPFDVITSPYSFAFKINIMIYYVIFEKRPKASPLTLKQTAKYEL